MGDTKSGSRNGNRTGVKGVDGGYGEDEAQSRERPEENRELNKRIRVERGYE